MKLRNRLEVMRPGEYVQVHDASLKILWETGVVMQSQTAREVMRHHGAKVDGQTVFIPEDLVQKALDLCQPTYRWQARNNARSVLVGEDFLVQPNAGPAYIQDLDRGRRPGTIRDYGNIIKLCQSSDVVNLVGAHPVNPGDVPDSEKHLWMMQQVMAHSDKPVLGYVCQGFQARQMLDMVELSFGKHDYLLENHCAGVSVNPLSSLAWAEDSLETLMEYAGRNQAVFLLPCIMAGISGPASLMGTVILQNTEILSGIVLAKMVNPQAPVVYSPSSSVGYMKKASYVTGTPEGMLINIANLQIARELYHLPTRCMCGMTDSKTIDCQAGYETMQNLIMGMLGGAHILVECLGVLDSIMTTSYEKFIIDEEIIRRVKRICAGIDCPDDAFSTEVIQEVGPGGSYLTHASTYERFRDFWQPTVSDWDSYQDWQMKGEKDTAIRANEICKKRLAAAPDALIEPEIGKMLGDYIQQVIKK